MPRVGQPYVVNGVRYEPRDEREYDRVGTASWYGPGFHGQATASGEPFDQEGLTAAHPTLPLPSFVEVSKHGNRPQVTVRVNDRGPFVGGRIIDLSRRTAQLLAMDRSGTATVRVRRVYPTADSRRPALSPPGRPAPVPMLAAAPAHPASASFVQVAALSDRAHADALAVRVAAFGAASIEASPAGLWRVRLGPFDDNAARTMLDRVRSAGYAEARVVGGAGAGGAGSGPAAP